MRVHSTILLFALHGASLPWASLANPLPEGKIDFPTTTDSGTETEAETEIEAAAGNRKVAGALALGSAVGSLAANGLAQVMLSGSLDMKVLGHMSGMTMVGQQDSAIRFADADFDGRDDFPQGSDGTEGSCFISTDSSEAEAEVEVESEVEVEVGAGSAVAVGGTSIACGSSGYQSFLTTDGESKPVKAQTLTAVDGQTSTSTSVGTVAGDSASPIQGPIDPDLSDPLIGRDQNEEEPTQSKIGFTPYLKIDSETEVEVESEAEAAAETAPGAAAAAASGGTGVAVVGDFSSAAALTSVATSTSASELDTVPARRLQTFNDEAKIKKRRHNRNLRHVNKDGKRAHKEESHRNLKKTKDEEPTDDGPVGPVEQGFDPVSPDAEFTAAVSAYDNTGRGLFEAESEAEAEAEVAAEVGVRSAAVSVVVTGGAGQTGIAASTRVAVSSSASTSTIFDSGTEKRANDFVATVYDRETGLSATYLKGQPAEAEVEVEASATIQSDGMPMASIGPLEETSARGQSTAAATILLAGTINGDTNEVFGFTHLEEVPRSRGVANPRPPNGDGEFSALLGNLETEVESEVEVEAEAEVAFEAAAAGAGAVAVQGRNGIPSVPAEAATATSASTKVLNNAENRVEDLHLPGPAQSGGLGGFPGLDLNLDCVRFETEMEAEAEAEVGYFAGAAAAAASGVGTPPLAGYGAETNLTSTLAESTLYAAAAVAAAGPFRQVWIEIPDENAEGEQTVRAYALARDPNGGAVAVAVAVAGVPGSAGADNEMEMEAEGVGEVSVMVEITYNKANAVTNVALFDPTEGPSSSPSSPPTNLEGETGQDDGEGVDSTFEDESEAEAEAEAEAGYGVAAASAGAGASGFYSDASAATSTSSMMPDGGFDYAAIMGGGRVRE